MQQSQVLRVASLLNENSNEKLGWSQNSHMGFAGTDNPLRFIVSVYVSVAVSVSVSVAVAVSVSVAVAVSVAVSV